MNKTRFAKKAWRYFRSSRIEYGSLQKNMPRPFSKFSFENIRYKNDDGCSKEEHVYFLKWKYKTLLWQYKDMVNMHWHWRGKHYYVNRKKVDQ